MVEKVSQEEFDELKAAARHDDLVSALKGIAQREHPDTSKLEALLEQNLVALRSIADMPGQDLAPLIDKITECMTGMTMPEPAKMPTSFRVERDRVGLIARVIPEFS